MFPVYTGINRILERDFSLLLCVPCIHRDKPLVFRGFCPESDVFPVYTGINRCGNGIITDRECVPCIHRDKPILLKLQKI